MATVHKKTHTEMVQTRGGRSQERGHNSAEKREEGGETEKHRGRTGTGVRAGDCGVGPFSWESGLNLTAGNTTTVCLQAVTEAQAAPRAAPTPHSKSTSLTDGGSDVTGPHIRPVCASCQ